jgi:hypothetical protein
MPTFHIHLPSEFQTHKFCSFGQRKLCLPELSGQGDNQDPGIRSPYNVVVCAWALVPSRVRLKRNIHIRSLG